MFFVIISVEDNQVNSIPRIRKRDFKFSIFLVYSGVWHSFLIGLLTVDTVILDGRTFLGVSFDFWKINKVHKSVNFVTHNVAEGQLEWNSFWVHPTRWHSPTAFVEWNSNIFGSTSPMSLWSGIKGACDLFGSLFYTSISSLLMKLALAKKIK